MESSVCLQIQSKRDKEVADKMWDDILTEEELTANEIRRKMTKTLSDNVYNRFTNN